MGANVQRGKKQTKNLAIIPHAWVRMNIRKTGQYDYMNIGPPIGSTIPYSAFSDTTIITRPVHGNIDIEVITFKYSGGDQTIDIYNTYTRGRDTVDVFIDF
jgi:hypothetical protein